MKKKLTPDQAKVVAYLTINKTGTVREIQDACGMTEVRSRISELRNKGFVFSEKWETGPNKYGEMKRFKRFGLEKSNEQD